MFTPHLLVEGNVDRKSNSFTTDTVQHLLYRPGVNESYPRWRGSVINTMFQTGRIAHIYNPRTEEGKAGRNLDL